MTLDPLPGVVAHRRERWGTDEQARADWEAQEQLESEVAEQARWELLFARMTAERPAVHYVNDNVDRRLFAVGGKRQPITPSDDAPDVA